MNTSNQTITGSAVCFRDPDLYYYNNSPFREGFCEQLIWSHEYLNMISSFALSILGFYQLTWENHNLPVLRFIAGLFIICGISSFLNHLYNTRPYMLLENFTFYLIEYILLSIILEKYCRNVQIKLNSSGVYKSTITQQTSQILTGLNWSFSTFFIYFLLYRDIDGCDWGTSIYKFGYLLPICILLILVGFGYYLDQKHALRVGSVSHSYQFATSAFNYFVSGVSLMFIGLFVWILSQSTCVDNSGIEYIPSHAIMHICFVYGATLTQQYYIFLCNDLSGNKLKLSSRRTDSNKCLNILFPYFMTFKGIQEEETERMLNDIQPKQRPLTNDISTLSDDDEKKQNKVKDLKQSIEIANKQQSKKIKKQEKMRKKQEERIVKRMTSYDEFDVNDYMHNNRGTTDIIYDNNDDDNDDNKREIELEMINTNKTGNDVEEEEDPDIDNEP